MDTKLEELTQGTKLLAENQETLKETRLVINTPNTAEQNLLWFWEHFQKLTEHKFLEQEMNKIDFQKSGDYGKFGEYWAKSNQNKIAV